ncbi:MAG TPA: hypothetical protein VMS02_02115, partial [Solirubrobacteraceae bacterium]|nr:hypothetical protein [Solirubrobacteraceae bacterium]
RLRWSATGEDGVHGYQVCAGATCATTTAEEIALALPPGAAPQTVTVTPVGVATTGLASSVAVVAPLTVQSGSYAGGRLSLTPSAAGTTSPALLQLDVLIDGAPAARMQASTPVNDQLEVPVALPPGVCAAVRLSGVGAGPLAPTSAAATIPSTPPAHVAAAYDGAELHIAWQPTAEPGVSGYLITVAGATPPVAARYVAGAGTNTTTIAATFPDPFPGAAAVTVRASAAVAGSTNGRIDGPASASTAPTLAPSVRAIGVHASAQPPYLLRHGAYVTRAGAEMGAIAVYLENVFTSDHPSPVTDGHTPPIFTLVSLAPPVSGPPCRLTIDKSVWTSFDGTAARAALRTSHREFLRKLEAAGVVAGAVALLREAIASALPQTFTETLYYRYGVWQEPGLRTLDLSPGMRLRLGGAAYQAPAATTVDPRNGFVALGDEQYELAEVFPVGSGQSALAPALTIDAFLSSLIPGAGGRSTTVAASAYDFFGLGARQAYFRLFYPSALAASGSIGSTAAKDNVLVIGAPSWEALESATETYADRGEAPLTGDIFAAYFRGRALLTPLVAVTIDGRERWVPLGTSVRQLLAAAGAPAVGPSAGAQLRMTRPAPAISDWARGAVAMHAEPVDLSTAELGGAVPQLWPIDLPLLGGDALTLVPAP